MERKKEGPEGEIVNNKLKIIVGGDIFIEILTSEDNSMEKEITISARKIFTVKFILSDIKMAMEFIENRIFKGTFREGRKTKMFKKIENDSVIREKKCLKCRNNTVKMLSSSGIPASIEVKLLDELTRYDKR